MNINTTITLLVLFNLTACGQSAEEVKQQTIKRENDNCVSGLTAFVYSKYFVEQRLSSPSTADFPFSDYTTSYLGDCTHMVSSYVDAQNGFGATVRTYYKARMQYNKSQDEWRLISIDM